MVTGDVIDHGSRVKLIDFGAVCQATGAPDECRDLQNAKVAKCLGHGPLKTVVGTPPAALLWQNASTRVARRDLAAEVHHGTRSCQSKVGTRSCLSTIPRTRMAWLPFSEVNAVHASFSWDGPQPGWAQVSKSK